MAAHAFGCALPTVPPVADASPGTLAVALVADAMEMTGDDPARATEALIVAAALAAQVRGSSFVDICDHAAFAMRPSLHVKARAMIRATLGHGAHGEGVS